MDSFIVPHTIELVDEEAYEKMTEDEISAAMKELA